MTRGPGRRAGLTTDGVLDAARDLLAERGIDGITMRALATRLDVTPNALYSHVPGKTELVDALLDDVLSAVEDPEPDVADPLVGLRTILTSTYELLLAHPDLVPLYLARQGARGPHAVRLGAAMDALLTRAGLDPEVVPAARRTLIVHAIGSAAFASGGGTEQPVAPMKVHEAFDAGLRWLLAGISAG